MARYIDIEGVGIGKAKREQFLVPEFAEGWNAVLKILEKEPTADVVEVKHAKWEINSDGYYPYCSHCKTEPKNGVMSKYCPECGAKMDSQL